MSSYIYLTTLGLFLGTILVVFGMKYASAALQARARIAEESRYRELAERSAALQAQTQATLAVVQAELARVAAGVTGIDEILKQVE